MNKKTGYALIVVLWLIVILTIIFVNLIEEAQLNSLLLRNNLQRRELNQAAIGGVLRGINLLQTDKTTADTRFEKWAQTIKFRPDSHLVCRVKISDIGSKLNLNYAARADFLRLQQQLEWEEVDWQRLTDKLLGDKELDQAEKKEEITIISNLVLLKKEFKSPADYQQVAKIFTTYGYFNPNLHSQAGWEKLLLFLKEKLDLASFQQNELTAAVNRLKQEQATNKSYATVKEFLRQVLPTSPQLRKKVKPYLRVTKRINVNFVNQAVLQLILSKLDQTKLVTSPSKTAQEIVDYCAHHPVKKLSKLDQIGVGMISQDLAPYLTTHSSYLLIEATAVNHKSRQEQKVRAVVHKIRSTPDKVKVQIIKWQQNY